MKQESILVEIKRVIVEKLKKDSSFKYMVINDTEKKFLKNVLNATPSLNKILVKDFMVTRKGNQILYINYKKFTLKVDFRNSEFKISKETEEHLPRHKIVIGHTEITEAYVLALSELNKKLGISLKNEIKRIQEIQEM